MTLGRRPRRASELEPGLPDPARLWIRWTPRHWPRAGGWWTDPAKLRLVDGDAERSAATVELATTVHDDVVWLPPVAPEARADRNALIERLAAEGVPLVVQRLPDEASGPEAIAVYDLTASLLTGEVGAASRVPTGSWALWPLIPGLTDAAAVVAEGLDAMAAAGVAGVHVAVPELSPAFRRALAAGVDEATYSALFHGSRPEEAPVHRQAASRGLAVFPPRPLPPASARSSNRRLAEVLFRLADLWRRLDRPIGRGETLWAEARRVDAAEHDLARLARDCNLGIVDWLERETRELLEEAVRSGGCRLLEALKAEYLGT